MKNHVAFGSGSVGLWEADSARPHVKSALTSTGSRLLLALLAAVPMADATAVSAPVTTQVGLRWNYNWSFNIAASASRSDAKSGQVSGRSFIMGPIEEQMNLTGPGDSRANIFLGLAGSLSRRSLGAIITAGARTNPYDPEDPDLAPRIVDTTGQVEILLTDRVRIRRLNAGGLQPVGIEFAAPQISGSLNVPPESLGTGSNIFQTSLRWSQVQCSICFEGDVFNYEKVLVSGTGEDSWSADQDAAFAAPSSFSLTPGASYLVTLRMQVAAQFIPTMEPPNAPPYGSTRGEFGSTLIWGGVSRFTDAAGNPLNDVVIESELGFDWTSPVPEPASGALMLSGLLALAGVASRRQTTQAK